MRVVLDKYAKMPVKAHKWDAGYDLFAREDFEVPSCVTTGELRTLVDYNTEFKDNDGEVIGYGTTKGFTVQEGYAIHDTGVHMEIPKGYVGFLKSKSGLNVKHGLTADGVIDYGYTGSIVVKLYNHTDKPYKFKKGDKITQLVILPILSHSTELELVDSLEETERGDGGFGSTGK